MPIFWRLAIWKSTFWRLATGGRQFGSRHFNGRQFGHRHCYVTPFFVRQVRLRRLRDAVAVSALPLEAVRLADDAEGPLRRVGQLLRPHPQDVWVRNQEVTTPARSKQDPILRLWKLQLQRQCCSRLERFMKLEELFLFSKRTRQPQRCNSRS
jgi:hypothetical protein